ncbi:MAG TPA: diacylglycerol kinase family lipid kinase [Candidatus Krumholzibacteria bacterium]|nr:diacylglycerol kinase family lipid kinase [Candidatus Krumholzibacteria bacterium]HRX52133.1 diacylglycerol kinase family lipid kinase [Candidatus Krumholzibacteria bacterium]
MADHAATIVVNPVSGSGRGEKLAADLAARLEKAGWSVEIKKTRGDGDAERFAAAAVEAGHDLVVAAGGDGTVQEVLCEILKSEGRTALAHLPAGTTNAIARAFGIGTDMKELAESVVKNRIRSLDVGLIPEQGRHFLLMATIGDPSRLVSGATRDLKNKLGFFAYVLAGLRAMLKPGVAHVGVEAGPDHLRGRANGLIVANITRLQDPPLDLAAGKGAWDDGLLDVMMLHTRSALDWFRLALAVLLRSRALEGRRVQRVQARRIAVEAEPPLPVQVDGEVIGDTPLTVEVLPRALRVVVGASLAGSGS